MNGPATDRSRYRLAGQCSFLLSQAAGLAAQKVQAHSPKAAGAAGAALFSAALSQRLQGRFTQSHADLVAWQELVLADQAARQVSRAALTHRAALQAAGVVALLAMQAQTVLTGQAVAVAHSATQAAHLEHTATTVRQAPVPAMAAGVVVRGPLVAPPQTDQAPRAVTALQAASQVHPSPTAAAVVVRPVTSRPATGQAAQGAAALVAVLTQAQRLLEQMAWAGAGAVHSAGQPVTAATER